jgi:hypothetical protein
MDSCIKQMIARLLKRSRVEHAVLHFCDAKACDAQNFSLG